MKQSFHFPPKGFLYIVFIALAGTINTGCKKEDSNIAPPGNDPLPERIITDTMYGMDARQKMDIYLPAGRSADTKVIFLIHGGGWQTGDKNELNSYMSLVRNKWPEVAVVNINYRLSGNSPAVHYNEIMNDIKAAVSFIITNKTKLIVSDTLGMIGASAGAHLAMLYTYKFNTNNYVKCVADFFGPAKLSDWEWYNSFNPWVGVAVKDVLTQYIGEPWNQALYDSNSPYEVITAQSAPTIIFHGTADVIVPLYQSQWLKAKLATLNVPHEYYEYVLDGHGFNVANSVDAITKTIIFFKQYLH
ncbi:MAG: alpha/beta hydrolase [Ferruginibacter sp.]